MNGRIPKFAAFFVIWLVLCGSSRLIDLALGVVVALVVAWLNPVDPASAFRNLRWLSILGYLPWLFVRILSSGIHVSRLILDPSLPIAPKLIHYRTELLSDGEIVLLGNSVTLTPGTITVEVNSNELIVHTIDDAASQDLIERRFEQKITHVFRPEKAAP
jgi:multicomponent Na+:H+ antiporter subunit E